MSGPLNVNLAILNTKTRMRMAVAKMVQYNGKTIIHAYAKDAYKQRNIDAWGIDRAVLTYGAHHGVTDVYLWVAKQKLTYYTALENFDLYGSAGHPSDWGQNMNLPTPYWNSTPGRIAVPWVPDSAVVVVPPVPIVPQQETVVREEPPPQEPAIQQGDLFAEAS